MWWRVIFKEILKRKWGFLFSALAVGLSVCAYVVTVRVTGAMNLQFIKVTKDMGQNLFILPYIEDESRYYLGDFSDLSMPERTVEYVARQNREIADHYVGQLQQRWTLRHGDQEMAVVLIGLRKEIGRNREMVPAPQPGQAFLGSTVAKRFGLKNNDVFRIDDRPLTVAKVQPLQGSIEDIHVYLALADAQAILNKPGQINMVAALSCLCVKPIGAIATDIEKSLNDWQENGRLVVQTRVIPALKIGMARETMRTTVKNFALVFTAVLSVICAALLCGYLFFNIRERQHETGVMLAIGMTPLPIVRSILAKLGLIAVVGWAGGLVGGLYLAAWMGGRLNLMVAAGESRLLGLQTLGVALGLILLAGVYPLILVARTEPATILKNA